MIETGVLICVSVLAGILSNTLPSRCCRRPNKLRKAIIYIYLFEIVMLVVILWKIKCPKTLMMDQM